MTQQLQQIIDTAWEDRANLSPKQAPKEVADAVEHVIAELNTGKLRVATREGVGQWRAYADQLGPNMPMLDRWVKHWGYEG